MDPHVVFDCQKVLPNTLAPALAAAALARGGEPRLDMDDVTVRELAPHQAAGMFREREFPRLLSGSGEAKRLPSPDPAIQLHDGGRAAPSPDPAPVNGRRFIHCATKPTRRNERC